jgi:hypothetical protein
MKVSVDVLKTKKETWTLDVNNEEEFKNMVMARKENLLEGEEYVILWDTVRKSSSEIGYLFVSVGFALLVVYGLFAIGVF